MMTESPERSSEIAAYRLAVERHLSDLYAAERDELLADLESHLEEVAAELEPGVSLADRVGSPESYARELRETMVVERETSWTRVRRSLAEVVAPLTERTKRTADRFAASAGVGDAAALREQLRPGWWVLRGVLAALLFVSMLAAVDVVVEHSMLMNPVGFVLLVAITVLCVWGSLRLGRRSEQWTRRRQLLLGAAGVAIAVIVGSQVSGLVTGVGPTPYRTVYYEEYDRYEHVTDLYVYDAEGNLLTGVHVFDQNGDPLRAGDPYQCDPAQLADPFSRESADVHSFAEQKWAEVDDRLGFAYPLCVIESAPTEEPTAEAGPPEEPAGGDPSESPTDTPPEEPTEDEPTSGPAEEPTEAPAEDAKDSDEE